MYDDALSRKYNCSELYLETSVSIMEANIKLIMSIMKAGTGTKPATLEAHNTAIVNMMDGITEYRLQSQIDGTTPAAIIVA